MRHHWAALALVAAGCATSTAAPGGASAPPPAPVRADDRAALRGFVDSLTGAAEFRNAHWGILIVDPARGDTLYSRNAGKLFMPASNQKILTGAVALARLGPDYRFRTVLARRGVMRRDTLVGDLVVVGTGDPSVSDRMRGDAMQPLRAAADSLRARGVRVVTGSVVAGGDALPGPALGYGWAWDDLDAAYSAGVDELLFNEGFSRVVVHGGAAVGAPLRVAVRPAAGYPRVDVVGRTLAPASAPPADGSAPIAIAADAARLGTAVLTGGVPPGDSVTLEIAHREPARAYLAAFGQALGEAGVKVLGGPPRAGVDTLRADTLVTLLSPTLAEILPALEKPSQNQIAELVFRTLGREGAGVGSSDSARAVVERQLRAWGADSTAFVIRDGSGLSRHNYVAPATVVRVLDATWRAPYFRAFYDALPIAGVDGTIANRMRGTAAAGNVRAKTGYIDRARSLSGYVTTADGRVLIFSMLANNWTVPVKAVERVQDAVAARLAALHLDGQARTTVGGR